MVENLIAEIFGIVVTVFVINVLLKSRERRRWRPLQDHALMTLKAGLHDVLVFFQSKFGLYPDDLRHQAYTSTEPYLATCKFFAEEVVPNFETVYRSKLASVGAEKWGVLLKQLREVKIDFETTLSMFPQVFDDPELGRLILNVRNQLNRLLFDGLHLESGKSSIEPTLPEYARFVLDSTTNALGRLLET
jgi:hypothetical protein